MTITGAGTSTKIAIDASTPGTRDVDVIISNVVDATSETKIALMMRSSLESESDYISI